MGEQRPSCVACQEMVKDWYDEESNWNYNTGTGRGVTAHFTQIIWRETTELGVGTAVSRTNRFFTVARYYVRGNMGWPNDYKRNVPPPIHRRRG